MVRKYEGREEKVVELYPDGYSKTWREHEDNSIDDIEWAHYVAKLKEHEARRASANEREEYWKTYKKYKKQLRRLDPETGWNMEDF